MSNKDNTVDPTLVRELAGILKDTDLTEIEIESGETRIRVSRTRENPVPQQMPMHYQPAPMQAQMAPSQSPLASAPLAGPEVGSVPSPMVGTVYLGRDVGTERRRHLVEVGQQVSEGQTIVIIEAMKTMNQIPAPRSGVVKRICVDNAQPVEYGEALVVIG